MRHISSCLRANGVWGLALAVLVFTCPEWAAAQVQPRLYGGSSGTQAASPRTFGGPRRVSPSAGTSVTRNVTRVNVSSTASSRFSSRTRASSRSASVPSRATTNAVVTRSVGASPMSAALPVVRRTTTLPRVGVADRSGDRTPGAITRGIGNVPVASRFGDGAPGVITRGFAAPPLASRRPAAPFGGVVVNRSDMPVNPSWDAGPSRVPRDDTAVISPPVNRRSEWYRRYRDRYNVYNHHRRRHYDPVFIAPAASYYIDQVNHVYGDYVNHPPIIVNAPQEQVMEEPLIAPDDGPPDDAAAQRQQDAERVEQFLADHEEQAGRYVGGLTPEKLHDLMIEGVQLFQQGDYDGAASTFLRVTLADRHNIDATLAYAVARFATGDYQISALAVRRGVRRMPEVVNSSFDVRDRYGNLEDFETHLARLEWFVVDHPDLEDGWTVLGFIRHFSGQRDLAVETFEGLKSMPKADLELVDIFLNAEPPVQVPQTQPADQLTPMVPPTSDRPLPPSASAGPVQLISIDSE